MIANVYDPDARVKHSHWELAKKSLGLMSVGSPTPTLAALCFPKAYWDHVREQDNCRSAWRRSPPFWSVAGSSRIGWLRPCGVQTHVSSASADYDLLCLGVENYVDLIIKDLSAFVGNELTEVFQNGVSIPLSLKFPFLFLLISGANG